MKAEYNSLLYAYESNHAEILDIMSDVLEIATEADSNTPDEINASAAVKDTVKSDTASAVQKTNMLNNVIERVRKFIKKIGEICAELVRKLQNRLRLMLETDKGFRNLYYKRKAMIKPYKSVQVITYSYNDRALDQPVEKIMKEIVQSLEKLRVVNGTVNGSARISEIIDAPQGRIVEVLLAPYVKSDAPISTMQDFIKYLVSEYRGEKKETVYQDTQLPVIEAGALNSSGNIATKCNNYLKDAQSAYNKIKGIEYEIRRSESDEKVIKLVASNAAKAATLYNAYSALIHAYYELKLEQSLNYRIILKKFYQF